MFIFRMLTFLIAHILFGAHAKAEDAVVVGDNARLGRWNSDCEWPAKPDCRIMSDVSTTVGMPVEICAAGAASLNVRDAELATIAGAEIQRINNVTPIDAQAAE